MPEKIDIATLQDPRDFLAEHGEYALVGLYLQVYWESLALGDEIIARERLSQIPVIVKATINLIKTQQDYENWLGIAVDILPEWTIMMLAEIDTALEGDGL